MREILFRGKRIDNEEWVEGNLNRCVVVGETHIQRIEGNLSTTMHKIDPETICQYTGLTDKNGRKIFEGEIIPYHFNDSIVGVVRFGKYKNPFNDDEFAGHVGFYVDWGKNKGRFRADIGYWRKLVAVKGNIFDDPKLLRASHEAEN